MQEQNFYQTIDLFGRATRASNWLLDHWWLLPVLLTILWFYRRIRNEHALLGALDERASAAFADIDALLAERHILIANLAETVKGFAVQESTVLREVMEARAKAMSNVGAARFDAENQIGMSLNSLFQLTENYPELQSSGHFQGLRAEMTRIEERVTAARRFYNLAVEEFNGFRRAFPANVIAQYTKTANYEKFNLGVDRSEVAAPVRVSFAA